MGKILDKHINIQQRSFTSSDVKPQWSLLQCVVIGEGEVEE
jgi:hypothetical protein